MIESLRASVVEGLSSGRGLRGGYVLYQKRGEGLRGSYAPYPKSDGGYVLYVYLRVLGGGEGLRC